MGKQIIKVLIFLASSLIFQAIVVLVIFVSTYTHYEVFNNPKYLVSCIKYDENYLAYCDGVSDISRTGIEYNCDNRSWDGCLENEYENATWIDISLNEYKKWLPLTFFGIGGLISVLVADRFGNHKSVSNFVRWFMRKKGKKGI